MIVHHIRPHIINHNEDNDDSNRIFNNSNKNFSAKESQISSLQFRLILKLIIHVLTKVLHLSRSLDSNSQNPRHKSVFKKLVNHLKE